MSNNYLSRYDALYWRMRRKAERSGAMCLEHYKGADRANISRYGKHPIPGTEAERVHLAGRG